MKQEEKGCLIMDLYAQRGMDVWAHADVGCVGHSPMVGG